MRTPGYFHQLATQQQQQQQQQETQSPPQIRQTPQPITTTSTPFNLPHFITSNRINLKPYESIRKEFHSHPELSGQESTTAARIVHHLSAIGLRKSDIHSGIGGHGVAAVLPNGPGPTILLRSDSDGLPVKEQTGLPYASTARQVDTDGAEKPVMHACGHDVHITCLLAAAETLVRTRHAWSGTVVFVFQPAEERLAGARKMVADGLYDLVPVPDVLLGQHVFPDRAGSVGVRAGPMMAATDSLKVTFYGRGAHASQPQNSVDPIVMGASAVVRLQTVVAREVAPLDTAVLTVSAFHGGEAENIIEGEAFVRINVRTYRKEVREKVLGAIKRIVKAEAQASGAEREPLVELTSSGNATLNDPEMTGRLSKAFTGVFGDKFNPNKETVMGSEDFGDLATAINRPSVFWLFGGTDPAVYDDAAKRGRIAEEIPINHSPFFAPVMQPTLQTGVDGMVAAAMTFVAKR